LGEMVGRSVMMEEEWVEEGIDDMMGCLEKVSYEVIEAPYCWHEGTSQLGLSEDFQCSYSVIHYKRSFDFKAPSSFFFLSTCNLLGERCDWSSAFYGRWQGLLFLSWRPSSDLLENQIIKYLDFSLALFFPKNY
jgi:hypothetical protein